MPLDVVFYGTRGSISAPHEDILRYGSLTSCVVVKSGDRSIVIDAGFGIGFYSDHLANKMGSFHVLISHFHWDHILALFIIRKVPIIFIHRLKLSSYRKSWIFILTAPTARLTDGKL